MHSTQEGLRILMRFAADAGDSNTYLSRALPNARALRLINVWHKSQLRCIEMLLGAYSQNKWKHGMGPLSLQQHKLEKISIIILENLRKAYFGF